MLLPAFSFAATVTPVTDIRFFGGQHFYNGAASALSGNFDMTISPAVKFNDRWSLIPTYMGSYQGTRDVQELAGGGTLFQDSTNHGVLVKGVYQPLERWKFKASGGARYEFLRESKDEKWGNGLFDYRKYTGGVETEYNHSNKTGGRMAYDFYTLNFSNYQSLESSQDPTLARELVGKDVLNSQNHLMTFGFWAPLPSQVRLNMSAYYNLRNFGDQPVVNAAGSLTGTDRQDSIMTAALGLSRPIFLGENVKMVGDLGGAYTAQDSDQNHYDARKTLFLSNYYDYKQTSFSPRLSAAFGGAPWVASLSGTFSDRNYAQRPIQDADGNYLTEKMHVRDIYATLSVSYPISKGFKLRALSNLGWSHANTKYDKVFKYNYRIANYLFGFSYEY